MREDVICGRNSVLELLESDGSANKILIAKGAGGGKIRRIFELAKSRGIPVYTVERGALERLAERNQGVVALVSAKKYSTLNEILDLSRKKGEDPLIVILDGIEDPQNLGAIIRTAEAVGAHGVVIPRRRAAGVTSAVVRASCGAAERMMIAREELHNAFKVLKKEGVRIVGASLSGEDLYSVDLRGPMALVIGGEDRGVSPSLEKKCDLLVRIPIKGSVKCLNSSVAAAIILYERLRRSQQFQNG